MEDTIRTKQAAIWRDELSIIHIKYDKDAELGFNDAKSIFSIVKELNMGTAIRPIITDIREAKVFSKEFKDFFNDNTVKEFAVAIGVLVHSPLSKAMANLYFKISKPTVPMQLFTHEQEALKWLAQYLDVKPRIR